LLHDWQRGTAAMHNTHDINLPSLLPFFICAIQKWTPWIDTRIVDEDIYLTELVDGLLNKVFHFCADSQVGWHSQDFPALSDYFSGDFVELCATSRCNNNSRTVSGVGNGDGSADAASPTGDNSDFIFELHDEFLLKAL
jgi:hypothetical protein